ncbi:MAG: hypothetical protein FWE66_03610 [Oscillospiraceae bacterium]|nr:hypothetical protein [Oscillospiraceae bacterium]
MLPKERFLSAMRYEGYDRPPARYYSCPEITDDLLKLYGLTDELALRAKLGCDFRQVDPPYIGSPREFFPYGGLKDGIWGEKYEMLSFGDGEGEYRESVYQPCGNMESIEDMEGYPAETPTADWYDYSGIEEQCDRFGEYVVWTGNTSVPDFINGISRVRGVERTLLDIATEDPILIRLLDMFEEFFYEKSRCTLEAGNGKIDVLCLGDDLGTQNGLLISPASFDRLLAPRLKRFVDLAHEYGALAMMHSCGSVYKLIPRFIDMGLDILEVVQIDAADMEIEKLHAEFYKKICFCGSMSVQSTLPFGSVQDVRDEVEKRKRLFREGGMVIAPTHQIQVGTPLENIEAMYRAIGGFQD